MRRETALHLLSETSRLLLVAALSGAIAHGQAPTAASATQTPATPPTGATAGSANGAVPDSTSDSNASSKKAKKVWTNDDVTGRTGAISVVGNANSKSKTTAQTPADGAYISSVKKKLQELQDKMAAADKELASLKSFNDGEPVSTADREFHKSYGNEPIAQQIAALQAKKQDLQSKIDALLDEARKKGVEPGQLR
jgi:hypothetical protein